MEQIKSKVEFHCKKLQCEEDPTSDILMTCYIYKIQGAKLKELQVYTRVKDVKKKECNLSVECRINRLTRGKFKNGEFSLVQKDGNLIIDWVSRNDTHPNGPMSLYCRMTVDGTLKESLTMKELEGFFKLTMDKYRYGKNVKDQEIIDKCDMISDDSSTCLSDSTMNTDFDLDSSNSYDDVFDSLDAHTL